MRVREARLAKGADDGEVGEDGSIHFGGIHFGGIHFGGMLFGPSSPLPVVDELWFLLGR
jgi:hypothetical protein